MIKFQRELNIIMITLFVLSISYKISTLVCFVYSDNNEEYL